MGKFLFRLLRSRALRAVCAGCIGIACLAQTSHPNVAAARPGDWPEYGGAQGQHFSPLRQIDAGNVSRLREAWRFDVKEDGGGGWEANPLVVGKAMYICTPLERVIKLDAETGKLLWKFESGVNSTQPCRGVTYWTDGRKELILVGVMNYLYSLDAATGKPVAAFGEQGRVDLRRNLRGDFQSQSIALTTPGVVYKDLIIVGGRTPESYPAPPGDVRAYDVRSGAMRWMFHTIPHPGEPGVETWPRDAWKYAGAANNWAGMAVDRGRGTVFVPTGSAVFDFYGGDRTGDDLYANTLLALNASTGKLLWHFQAVHHDIWDRDLASAPTLVTVRQNGRAVDAVAQTSKSGFVFVLRRDNGKPLLPIEERPVPASTVPGEHAAATQPFPVLPVPFTRQLLTENDLTQRTPEAHAWAVEQYKLTGNRGQFVPFELNHPMLLVPGFDGGGQWGGSAFDPASHVLYVNGSNIAWVAGLLPQQPSHSAGEELYGARCSLCHGADRKGQPPSFPSLLGVSSRLQDAEIKALVKNGKGRMPGFPDLNDAQMTQLLNFLHTGANAEPDAAQPEDSRPGSREMTSKAEAAAGSGKRLIRCRTPSPDTRSGWTRRATRRWRRRGER